MQLKNGTSVYSSDDKELGRIDRVVLDPQTNEVTHLIIRQGLLFTEDKVIPIGMVASTNEKRVTLNQRAEGLDLSDFEETYYIEADGTYSADIPGGYPSTATAPGLYSYPPVGMTWWGDPGYLGSPVPADVPAQTVRNIPQDTIALKEGARVVSRDDKHVGNVERVFIDSASNRATHFLISQGLIFTHQKLVPTSWVANTSEDEVTLKVTSNTLEGVPDYQQ
jgi:uncharacterized protein YrrD